VHTDLKCREYIQIFVLAVVEFLVLGMYVARDALGGHITKQM